MGILAKTQGMGMAALLLAASTIISRCMGLVREKFISWQFGAGSEADIYFASFVIPDIINYLLAGGFMSIMLIPLLSRRFAEDEEDGWKFYSAVLTWMGLASIALTGLAMICVSPLASLAAPGLADAQHTRLAFFMCLTLPTQIFFLTGSCISALLFLRRQFVLPALTPLIYNGSIITLGVGLQLAGLVQGMTGYCIGVVIGAAIGAFLLPLYVARQGGMHYRPCLYHPLMKRFILLALPLMLGQTIAALDEQFLRVFGSLTGEGAVALLTYAKRISQVPVAFIGQVAAVASYPFLVSLLTRNYRNGFNNTLARALRTSVGLIVPMALWMAFLAPSTFTLLFYGGRMAEAEMLRAVPLLQILLCAAPFWVLLELLTRGFFAQTDTLTPAVSGTLITVVFLPIYYYVAVPRGPAAVAMCSVLGLTAYTAAIIVLWIRRHGTAVFRGLIPSAVKAGLCALPGSIGGLYLDAWIRSAMTGSSPILASFMGLACAGVLFLLTFVPLGMRFCPDLFDRVKERFGRRIKAGA